MTNKEAIAILEKLKMEGKFIISQRLALDLAIKALREFNINKEPEDKLCSERTLTVDAYKEWRKSL